MGAFIFGIAILVCWSVGGVALLLIAASWAARPAKSLFIAFVICLFLALPFLELIWIVTAFWLEQHGSYQSMQTLMLFNALGFSMLLMLAEALLIAYAVSRRASENGSRPPGNRRLTLEPTWDVEAPPHELVSILRKREWAFLIDLLPALVPLCATIMIAGLTDNDYSNRRFRISEIVVPLFYLGEIFAFIYLVLKDMVGGQSVGKRISGCRVVDRQTGLPIGFSQSLARNVIFLIPPLALLELAAASFRSDRRRFGDLLAGTVVVQGGPQRNADGKTPEQKPAEAVSQPPPVKHPLDD